MRNDRLKLQEDHKSSGFSVVSVVIAIVVIVAIGLAGWYVWRSNHPKPVQSSTTPSSKNSQKQANKVTSSTNTTTTTRSYMDITQWVVKVPLSSPISGLYYVVSTTTQGSNGQPNTMWLGLKSITSTSCTPTALNTNNTAIAAIIRDVPDATDPVSGELLTSKYPNGTTLGGYYYALDDQGTLESNCASQSTLQSIDSALQSAAKGIAAD